MGVVETWRRLMAKCVFKVELQEAKETCGTDQLCAVMEAVIEGGFHAMRLLWQKHVQEEDWRFLLIDAQKRVQ